MDVAVRVQRRLLKATAGMRQQLETLRMYRSHTNLCILESVLDNVRITLFLNIARRCASRMDTY